MAVIDSIASALNCNDEQPNIALAISIASKNDKAAVKNLVAHLHDKRKTVQNDCIKVLYEIGSRKPDLITAYLDDFLKLLQNKNNRLQWGAMTAISTIAEIKTREIFAALNQILEAAGQGSVISKDQAMYILIRLASHSEYYAKIYPILLAQLQDSLLNQLPMYAEMVLPVVAANDEKSFIHILQRRLHDVEKESKRKRIEKVIKKLHK